jgi:hypothetical protein
MEGRLKRPCLCWTGAVSKADPGASPRRAPRQTCYQFSALRLGNRFALAETTFYGIFLNRMIEVRHLSGDQYEVRVTGETPTTHQVTLKEADRVRLGGADIAGDELIAESFRFLLEREPNTSILRTFDLPVIGTYFPEYEQDIRKRVAER